MAEIEEHVASLRVPVSGPVITGWGTGLNGAGSVPAFSNLYAQAVSDLDAATTPTTAAPATAATAAPASTLLGALAALDASATSLALATAASGATARGKIGGFGAIAVPGSLRPYGNGRVPAEALTPIGIGNHRLWGPAAESFKQMTAAARADGVEIGVGSTYRTYDEQVRNVERVGLYSQGGWAAEPGTSNHGWGLAVDVKVDDRGQRWLRENGWRYGFVEAVPREPWHWEYRPAQSGALSSVAAPSQRAQFSR